MRISLAGERRQSSGVHGEPGDSGKAGPREVQGGLGGLVTVVEPRQGAPTGLGCLGFWRNRKVEGHWASQGDVAPTLGHSGMKPLGPLLSLVLRSGPPRPRWDWCCGPLFAGSASTIRATCTCEGLTPAFCTQGLVLGDPTSLSQPCCPRGLRGAHGDDSGLSGICVWQHPWPRLTRCQEHSQL